MRLPLLRPLSSPPPRPVRGESRTRVNLAVVALFTTEPTDRALAGWWPGEEWLIGEMDELQDAAERGGA